MNEQATLEDQQFTRGSAEVNDENERDELVAYRQHLVSAEKQSQDAYDKTVLSLSSGALGISFAFLSSIIGEPPYVSAALLFTAWLLWDGGSTMALVSFLLGQLSLRKAIQQIDQGQLTSQKPGGWYSVRARPGPSRHADESGSWLVLTRRTHHGEANCAIPPPC